MGINYRSGLAIKKPFNNKTIHLLLDYAEKEDFIFLNETGKPINLLQDAVKKVLTPDEHDFHQIDVRYHDTYFTLLFLADENFFYISMAHYTYNNWNKIFPNWSQRFVDNDRYLRLLLKICKNFFITEIFINTDEDPLLPSNLSSVFSAALLTGSTEKEIKEDMKQFMLNAYQHSFNILLNNHIIDYSELHGYSDQLACLLFKNNEIFFRLLIENFVIDVQIVKSSGFISFFPQKPFKMQGQNGKEFIDISFYTKSLLCFCENFAIQELRSYF